MEKKLGEGTFKPAAVGDEADSLHLSPINVHRNYVSSLCTPHARNDGECSPTVKGKKESSIQKLSEETADLSAVPEEIRNLGLLRVVREVPYVPNRSPGLLQKWL